MSDDKKSEELQTAEYLLELARQKGVATSSMRDGTLFTFTRNFLQCMLDKDKDQDEFMVFVKTETKTQN
jgi:hypothetical protein